MNGLLGRAALAFLVLPGTVAFLIRATLDAGHELATGGPYALVRHPICASMNLLALGTAVWIPTVFTWAALALMVVGSDLRGRAEESVLAAAFGEQYRQYCRRTKRFLPGTY